MVLKIGGSIRSGMPNAEARVARSRFFDVLALYMPPRLFSGLGVFSQMNTNPVRSGLFADNRRQTLGFGAMLFQTALGTVGLGRKCGLRLETFSLFGQLN
jgi:hypothetical protein